MACAPPVRRRPCRRSRIRLPSAPQRQRSGQTPPRESRAGCLEDTRLGRNASTHPPITPLRRPTHKPDTTLSKARGRRLPRLSPQKNILKRSGLHSLPTPPIFVPSARLFTRQYAPRARAHHPASPLDFLYAQRTCAHRARCALLRRMRHLQSARPMSYLHVSSQGELALTRHHCYRRGLRLKPEGNATPPATHGIIKVKYAPAYAATALLGDASGVGCAPLVAETCIGEHAGSHPRQHGPSVGNDLLFCLMTRRT